MKFTLLFVAFVAIFAVASAEKLPVQILLGSLCPDAIRFIQNQVYPLYPHVKDYVHFTFIPFGKARSIRTLDGSLSFSCQHGIADCSVSRIQQCAMAFMRSDPDAIMEFIACQMAFNSDRTGLACSNHVNLSYNNVTSCYVGPVGDLLQLQAERMTNEIQDPLDWVPTTTINWVFNQGLSRRAEFNLRAVICEQIDNVAPICLQ